MTRIIAGRARGRRLLVPPGDRTRPTSDRAREALFSALDARFTGFAGLSVLDLFAGSGAVGLEALSRGAARVTLVEADQKASAVIAKNVAAVGLGGVSIVTDRAERVADRVPDGGPYDFVFLDPPYAVPDADLLGILAALSANGWLRDGATVVVERSSRDPELVWPEPYEGARAKAYGEARMHVAVWYLRGASAE